MVVVMLLLVVIMLYSIDVLVGGGTVLVHTGVGVLVVDVIFTVIADSISIVNKQQLVTSITCSLLFPSHSEHGRKLSNLYFLKGHTVLGYILDITG